MGRPAMPEADTRRPEISINLNELMVDAPEFSEITG